MTLDELCQLNSDLVAIIKHRRKMASKDMGSMLSLGDKVSFEGTRAQTLTGVVEKIMRTRCIVNVDGTRWKCHLSTLTPIG